MTEQSAIPTIPADLERQREERLREEFEAWALTTGQFTKSDTRRFLDTEVAIDTMRGRYCNMALDDMWTGFKAHAAVPVTVTEEMATHAMLTAGGRAIGNTMRWDNHYERAQEVWRAMIAAKANLDDLPGIPTVALRGGV